MKNKVLTGLASLMLMFSISTLKADVNVGASVMLGQLDTSGSETEKVDLAGAADKNSKSFKETFYGASVFLELVSDNGFALGIDYVPVDVDIGDGKRTDTAAVAENDSGTRTASASLEDLITVQAPSDLLLKSALFFIFIFKPNKTGGLSGFGAGDGSIR